LYIDSNNTKTVLESIKKILDNSQKNRFWKPINADYKSQFQWF
jgi:Ca-activated chloride channel family protein